VSLLKACSSTHVLSLVDANVEWDAHVEGVAPFAYYVAEKCHGSLEERKPDLGDARSRLELFVEACKAVAYLHALPDPVIHRDIKPANFLLAEEPRRLVLADFGIARHEVAESTLTAIQEVVGSRCFRAPEVLNGSLGSKQSDVFSLGRLLEWLLTGAVSEDLGTRQVPKDGTLSDEACETLDRIIMKATHAVAADRYGSVSELSDAIPSLWLAVRPRPRTVPDVATNDPLAVTSAAIDLARSDDRIGWRQLEQTVRRPYADQLKEWRSGHENAHVTNRDENFVLVDDLVNRVMGRIAFSLAGVFSQKDGLNDQRRAVEDLVSVQDWNGGGLTMVVSAPRGLVYLFHYLHGALCMELGNVDLALRIAQSTLPRPRGADEQLPLWKMRDVTGWPHLFGGKADVAWAYLRAFPERQPTINQFFAVRADYETALASYSMLLSLLEAASDAQKLLKLSADDLRQGFSFDFPPMFVEMGRETIQAAFSRTFGNAEVVRRVAEGVGVEVKALRQLWPHWKAALNRFHQGIHSNWVFVDDLPLGDLA
jgi:hypothetical protein